MKGKLVYIFFYHRVVSGIDKRVGSGLVHYDAELAADIILELIIVTVEVVFGDIGEDRDIGPELDDIVELEAADLSHIPLFRVFRHLSGEGVAYIPHQCAVETAMAADMI